MDKPRKTVRPDVKKWMKENGYTDSDIQRFWEESKEYNVLYECFEKYGFTWKDLMPWQVDKLPSLKEEGDKKKAEREKERIREEERLMKEEEERKYYEEHFEEIMLKKIENNEKLTEDELWRCLDFEVEEFTDDEHGRWMEYVTTIVSLGDKYFSIDWDRGLTEMQDNEMNPQVPVEVRKVKKLVEVEDWEEV